MPKPKPDLAQIRRESGSQAAERAAIAPLMSDTGLNVGRLETEPFMVDLVSVVNLFLESADRQSDRKGAVVLRLLDEFDSDRNVSASLLELLLPSVEDYRHPLYRPEPGYRYVILEPAYVLAQQLAERVSRRDLLERMMKIEVRLGAFEKLERYAGILGRGLAPEEVWGAIEAFAEKMHEGTMYDPETERIVDSRIVNLKILRAFAAKHLDIQDDARLRHLAELRYDYLHDLPD